MTRFQSTWVWVRDTTDCPKCDQRAGQRCKTRTGRRTNQLHMARKIASKEALTAVD